MAKFCSKRAHPAGAKEQRSDFIPPEAYTPRHLAQKILTSKAVLEGEVKEVAVLFADLKGSMELLGDRDLGEARDLQRLQTRAVAGERKGAGAFAVR